MYKSYVFSVSTFSHRSEKGELRQQQPGIARLSCARMDVKPINRRRKCREGPSTTFQSRARLYMDAISMAKPRRRDVKGREIYSTVMNCQKCVARSCSSSVRPRGDRFSACRLSENVMHISCPLHTASRGSSRVGAALGSY